MNLAQGKELLMELLEVEVDRLHTAVRIEKERKIVFPETTVIIRDIQKLHTAIYGKLVTENEKKLKPIEDDLWDDIGELNAD